MRCHCSIRCDWGNVPSFFLDVRGRAPAELVGTGHLPHRGPAGEGLADVHHVTVSAARVCWIRDASRLPDPELHLPRRPPERLFATVRQQAVEAEESGFDTVLVMDHFYQLAGLGTPDQDMIECYTLLSALAQHTQRVRLSALVTGNTYRNPTLLAKTVTALDVVSGGRAQLGIGAGWFELEHRSLGYEFGTFTDRFEKLEESLQIVLPMLRGERPTLDGKWYQVHDAINHPAPLGRIPVMIGGGGERKTLRLVAQYADESNLICAGRRDPAQARGPRRPLREPRP